MQKTIISWTDKSWNPAHGCSRISEGCKFCYAETLSLRYGWTKKVWSIPNEAQNVQLKPKKLLEPYSEKEAVSIFVNSMSDLFHRTIPDCYRAAVFCVMLDQPRHTFQVLTKRPEKATDWDQRFQEALKHPEFIKLAQESKHHRKWGQKALGGQWKSPWGENVWMGTSVENKRTVGRIDVLRQIPALRRFVSAEPLLGPLGEIDLEGINQLLVGGESGAHMKKGNVRWMQIDWAREIKNQCLEQGAAFFYKQDSGHRTELRPYLVEEDGSKWKWEQYPGDLRPPLELDGEGQPLHNFDSTGKSEAECLSRARRWMRIAFKEKGFRSDNAALSAGYWFQAAGQLNQKEPAQKAQVVELVQPIAAPPVTAEPTQLALL